MMASIVIILTMVSGATTIISRLLKGNTVNVWYSKSICPVCQTEIPLKKQIPIISYLFAKGRCEHCNTKFGKKDLFIEVFTLIVLLAGFVMTYKSVYVGVYLGIIFNIEIILMMLIFKIREKKFLVNYLFSAIFSFVMLLSLSLLNVIAGF